VNITPPTWSLRARLFVGLLCTIAASACGSEKPRTESVIPARTAPSVGRPGTPNQTLSSRIEVPVPENRGLPDNAWTTADEQTTRLHPDAFANVPPAIVDELQRMGCTIPQTHATAEPHNVAIGRFLSATNRDWAVLCSRDGVSAILVFPNGAIDGVREVALSPDANWLQGIGGSQIGFSRAIAVADPRYILSHYEAYGGPQPPPLDHDGINEIFVEKASSVLYWHQGNWLRLQGAD
jgi:hypothetical protein